MPTARRVRRAACSASRAANLTTQHTRRYVFTKNSVSVAALLAHLLAGNLFAGRYVFSHARKRRVPAAHSIALCSVFSLVGLASHVVTCVLWRMTARLRGGDADGAFVTYRF